MPDNVALFAAIILLLPMIYLLLAAPAFLLVKLDIPAVAMLLRAMFNGYFLTLIGAAIVGTLAVAISGRVILALGIALLLGWTLMARRWFLARIDARLQEQEAGGAQAARGLRSLHCWGMLGNAIQLTVLVACIPLIAVVPS
jgi:hypothetical protein